MVTLPGSSTLTLTLVAGVPQAVDIEVTAETYVVVEVTDTGAMGNCSARISLGLYDSGLLGLVTPGGAFRQCPFMRPSAHPWTRLQVGRYTLVITADAAATVNVMIRSLDVDRCGNGVVDGMEECDDGNNIDADLCSNACVSPLRQYDITMIPNQQYTPPMVTQIPMSNVDDGFVTVTLPFDVEWHGIPTNTLHVSSNGLVGSISTNIAAHQNQGIPDPASPEGFITLWWDDLNPSAGGQIGEGTAGTSPNRVFHIVFSGVPHYQSNGAVNMAMRIFEGTNVVEVHYGQISTGTGSSASVGHESEQAVLHGVALACTPNCTDADWPTRTVIRYTPN